MPASGRFARGTVLGGDTNRIIHASITTFLATRYPLLGSDVESYVAEPFDSDETFAAAATLNVRTGERLAGGSRCATFLDGPLHIVNCEQAPPATSDRVKRAQDSRRRSTGVPDFYSWRVLVKTMLE